MNLNQPNYFTRLLSFNDAMKYSQDSWSVVNANGATQSGVAVPPLDADGWPTSLPSGYQLLTVLIQHSGNNYPAGTYTLSFDGAGTVVVRVGNTAVATVTQGATASTYPVQVTTPVDAGLKVQIAASDPTNYVRNIKLIFPGEASAAASGNPFYSQFLSLIKPFNLLRFAFWMQVNQPGATTTWAGRTTPTYRTQATAGGVAVELMVQLANMTGKNPWFSFPVPCDDSYVTQFAQYVHDNLNPSLVAHVEYGNEVWNFAYPYSLATNYVKNYGVANGITMDQAHADLASHLFKLWSAVFADNPARLSRSFMGQWGAFHTLTQAVPRLIADADPSDPNKGFDVLGTAQYYTPPASVTSTYTSSTTSAQIVSDIMASLNAEQSVWNQWAQYYAGFNQSVGRTIPIFLYEGGPGLVSGSDTLPWYTAYLQTQTDPGIYGVVQAQLKMLQSLGIVTCFNYEGLSYAGDKFGLWGAVRSTGESPLTTPKYNALVDWVSDYSISAS